MGPLAITLRKELNLPPEAGWIEHFTNPTNEPGTHHVHDIWFRLVDGTNLEVAAWYRRALDSTFFHKSSLRYKESWELLHRYQHFFIEHLLFRE